MRPLYLIAEIYPDPNKLAEAMTAYESLIVATRKEQGCLLYDLVVEEDSECWLMLEKWESRSAWNQHMTSEHVLAMNATSPEFSSQPTKLRFLESLIAEE